MKFNRPSQLPTKVVRILAILAVATLNVIAGASAADTPSAPPPNTTAPVAGQPWTNSLGVKFVPAGTDGVLFSIWDVRVKDYALFVQDTNHDWPKPKFTQTDNDPAVMVSWNDAHAFCDWLTKKEQAAGKLASNQKYRLPTDAEWSKAVGLTESSDGTPASKSLKEKGVYPWGTQWPPPSGAGNYDEKLTRDGFINTSPVGSFAANPFGLYDMGGNVWQWCEDLYGSTPQDPDSKTGDRVLRGACFGNEGPRSPLSSDRNYGAPDFRLYAYGFRVVVVVSP
jgi:formylglycine-generating enzyme required for sulfatase activity